MQRIWCIPSIVILIAFFLSACSAKKPEKPAADSQTVLLPCIITPDHLASGAMGAMGIRIIRIGDDVRIILPADNIFTPGEASIKPSAYPGLIALADYLKKSGCTPMQINGYTDELGLSHENQWFAEKQARSLLAFLWTRGINHLQMKPVGIGENEAYTVASNRSIAGSQANRRLEITFRAH